MLAWLFRCPLTDEEAARKWRLMNALLLAFLLLAMGILVLDLALSNPKELPTTGASLILIAAIYFVNHRGAFRVAAVALIIISVALVTAAALNARLIGGVLYPGLMVVPILLSGVVLSWRAVPLVVIASGLATFWLFGGGLTLLTTYQAANPQDSTSVVTLLILFVATGAFSMLIDYQMERTLARLYQRNEDLAAANQDLAEKSRQERRLGTDISTLVSELSTVSTRQVSGVSAQAAAISQIVGTIDELHRVANQIATSADEVRQAADSALTSVQRGQELVQHSKEAVQRNRGQVQRIVESMSALDETTRHLTRFVNSIQALAAETHLLALNATIEAAGAGSLGRRFSVVAGEVQNLAARSNEVVAEIRSLIERLQRAGQETLGVTQSSIAIADEVEELAGQVGAAHSQIVRAVEQTHILTHNISSATMQQRMATGQVTETMQEISQVADATRSDTRALDRAIKDLTHMADLLTSALTNLQALGET